MIYDNTFLELGQNMQTEVKSTIEVIDTNDSTISNNLNKNLLLTKSTEDKMILTHEFEKKKNSDDIYDCCICRLSSVTTPERPIGMVALIQSTSGITGFLIYYRVVLNKFTFHCFIYSTKNLQCCSVWMI